MRELQNNEWKLSHLSKKLNLTVTETSRHLQRLNEAKLVQKNYNGLYRLTQFGRLSILMLKNLDFLSANINFFLEYDVNGIPQQFLDRLGELKEAKYIAKAFENLEEGEQRIREAQQFVWILSDDVLSNTIPVLSKKIEQSFDLRIVLPEGKFPPEDASRLPLKRSGIQKRVLSKINVLIVMTESYAVLCLPNWNGRIDYTGFSGKDPIFRKWCKDLFLYYWDEANPLH
jgi:predicted transcriptional regulator